MKLIKNILKKVFENKLKGFSQQSANFIFYKIVHFYEKENKYLLQCINTSATFLATIKDIVFDMDILHGLHPVQACYIGIEYATNMKKIDSNLSKKKKKINSYPYPRYGIFRLRYHDRKQNVSFTNIDTGEVFLMDPRDIAFSENLIQEFDAAQSFYIGLLAGLKMNNFSVKNILVFGKKNTPVLRLINNIGKS
ncbi:hypothetical protein AYO45_01895 [Gammaproteobacteria bacterium SCGC AG-212-F23]|nr:hypothetical protein AYO45_01895 [Gammaproteobacteria bacterium SCGC AG-212-F23]